ncbi:hypothetical protein OF83DRAFT_1081174 [Amylostereum chailletii]|nr:hypothetical protein OF83DRAFT_1081174 [Amylostereum chailletii]
MNGYSQPLWDFSQAPATYSQLADDDFLALLQKQFSSEITPVTAIGIPHDGIDPAKLTTLSAPPPPPLSTDSSPSPSSANDNSRRESASFDSGPGEDALKRKASDEDLEEGPSHKTSKKTPTRRKSGSQDETRLLKRKEQNRAAQRAFRERKEKHVKDLEDKLAALQSKNDSTQTENTHLRDMLKRLQEENVALKQSQFTFSVPKSSGDAQPFNNVATTSFGSSPGSAFNPASATSPSSSKDSSSPSSSLDTPSNFPTDVDFGSLTPFDSSSLSMLDENGDANMSYDFGFGQYIPSNTPYKTIASNPMFMSFADPSGDFGSSLSNKSSPPSAGGGSFDMSFGHWTGQSPREEGSTSQLDELFGGGHMFNAQTPMSPMSFNAVMNNAPASSLSPVLHTTTSVSTPSSNQPSPPQDTGECPRTKEQLEQRISDEGSSMFAPPPPSAEDVPMPVLRKGTSLGGDGPMIMCKGAAFPPTEKRDDNVEVLAAWRSITSHPHFKAGNIDINELCAEFTDKARCDGTKVVLNQQGVTYILNKLTQKISGPTAA